MQWSPKSDTVARIRVARRPSDAGEPGPAGRPAGRHPGLQGRPEPNEEMVTKMTLAALKKVDSATLHEKVYDELRRAIMAGVFPPGQMFSLNQLSQALGTSPMPIREALRHLAAERAVTILPQRGVVIPKISREKYAEVGVVRLQLEGMAAEMAAARITDHDIADLEVRCQAMNAIMDDPARWQDYVVMNCQFHFKIYGAGQPHVLLPLIESLWLQSGPLLSVYGDTGVPKKRGLHEAIIEALCAHDAETSRRAIQADITHGINYISSIAQF